MAEPILDISHVSKTFRKAGTAVHACQDVSLSVYAGKSLALVGQSGSGKTTLARMIVGLESIDTGSIRVCGIDVGHASASDMRHVYKHVQMVFQNPIASFNPRKTLGTSIVEGASNAGVSADEARQRVPELLQKVGLPASFAARYPSQVSGGQCQRAALARALAFRPDLIICDEATSALDVLVQAEILRLIKHLQQHEHISFLFICHDLAVAEQVSDSIAVMLDGRIVEQGPSADVIAHPTHPFTRLLKSSVFPVERSDM